MTRQYRHRVDLLLVPDIFRYALVLLLSLMWCNANTADIYRSERYYLACRVYFAAISIADMYNILMHIIMMSIEQDDAQHCYKSILSRWLLMNISEWCRSSGLVLFSDAGPISHRRGSRVISSLNFLSRQDFIVWNHFDCSRAVMPICRLIASTDRATFHAISAQQSHVSISSTCHQVWCIHREENSSRENIIGTARVKYFGTMKVYQ